MKSEITNEEFLSILPEQRTSWAEFSYKNGYKIIPNIISMICFLDKHNYLVEIDGLTKTKAIIWRYDHELCDVLWRAVLECLS